MGRSKDALDKLVKISKGNGQSNDKSKEKSTGEGQKGSPEQKG
jgi:hypothetical protein